MNDYDLLPTAVLEFLKDFCMAIHHAGKRTEGSQANLQAIKAELYIRRMPPEKDL